MTLSTILFYLNKHHKFMHSGLLYWKN